MGWMGSFRKEILAFWAKQCAQSKSHRPNRCAQEVSLPPVHPASSAGPWPWVCWVPDAGSAHWAQALGILEPLWAAGHVLDRAWMWKALHLPGWSPWGYWAVTQHKQMGKERKQKKGGGGLRIMTTVFVQRREQHRLPRCQFSNNLWKLVAPFNYVDVLQRVCTVQGAGRKLAILLACSDLAAWWGGVQSFIEGSSGTLNLVMWFIDC